ncbi:MAG TPA: DUF4395 family protein [Candidatus Polarisedimenticolaceae bacterium]
MTLRPIDVLRRRIEAQGFCGYDDAAISEFGPWLRLTTGLCAAWAAAATADGSVYGLWLLAVVALLGAAFPHHPFDAIHDLAIRRWTHARPLPPNGIPRRFGCAVAAAWLLAAGAAFRLDAPASGYGLGFSLVGAALVPTLTDFCISSWLFGRLFGAPCRARSSAFLERTTSGC